MLVCVVVTAVLSGLLGLWALWYAVRDRPVLFKQLIGAGVVEALLLVQIVIAVIAVMGGRELAEPWTFWGYLVTAVLLLPVAAVWAMADRTRTSSVTLIVASVAVIAMQWRVFDLWGA